MDDFLNAWRPDRTLRGRMFVVVAALVLIVVVFQALYYPSILREESVEALEVKALTVSRILADNVVPGVEFGDKAIVEQSFGIASSDPELVFADVYGTDGAKLATYKQGTWNPRGQLVTRTDEILVVEVPVTTKGGGAGKLVAAYSMERPDTLGRQHQRNALLAAGGILLFGLIVAGYLGSSVGRTVEEIAEVSSRIASGRLDVPQLDVPFNDEVGRMATDINTMVASLKVIESHVGMVARGDLRADLTVEGDLARALDTMVRNQRELVVQIAQTAAEISTLSAEMLATSTAQERGANEQSSVVEETLRTMETLLNSANRISENSTKVMNDAEATHSNNQSINERITELAGHTDRIGEFLEVIRDIANKTELLALNAALEGTRAGEAGRGFSLVASQMQRLTESVMDSVRDIKQLTADIREATNASVLATEQGTQRASNTARSARQISLIIQQQRSGTEQVTASMDEISRVIRHSVAASAQGAEAAAQLSDLSGRLQRLVRRFNVAGQADEEVTRIMSASDLDQLKS